MAETNDDLYRLDGLALEEFTPARDRLAVELRFGSFTAGQLAAPDIL